MSEEYSEGYKKYLKEKIEKLIPIFAKASIGDFSESAPVPEEDDEFTEVYTGINIMLKVIRDKIGNLELEIETRKKIQEALAKREEFFNSTLDRMAEGFQIIGYDYQYLYVNNALCIQGRKSREALLGRTMMEVYPDIDKAEFFVQLARCMHDRVSHNMENEFVFPDGNKGWFELRIEPIPEGVFILSLDITKRKTMEQRIAKETAEAKALLASIGDGIIATDAEGRIILVNKACEELLGIGESEMEGKYAKDLFGMQDEKGNAIKDEERPLLLALKKGMKITATHYLVRKDQAKFPTFVTATPVELDGKIIGAIKVFHDITREKELEKAKDEFISLASHELRTPMTAIRGLISMIVAGDYGPINDGLKRPLENIKISSDRQVQLINDLLDVSRLQMGTIKFHLTTFSIKKILEDAVGSLQVIASQKGVKLVLSDVADIQVQADEVWVRQVLNNLVGNALKFTNAGSITISTQLEKDFDLIVVVDTGVGIDASDQDKLFERFAQLKNNAPDKYHGTGLGLYISRGVARKMGGDIRLQNSRQGQGSTFVFSIPRAETPYAQSVREKIEKEMQIAFAKKNS